MSKPLHMSGTDRAKVKASSRARNGIPLWQFFRLLVKTEMNDISSWNQTEQVNWWMLFGIWAATLQIFSSTENRLVTPHTNYDVLFVYSVDSGGSRLGCCTASEAYCKARSYLSKLILKTKVIRYAFGLSEAKLSGPSVTYLGAS